MIEIRGKYNTAKVYTDIIEEAAISQIIELCNQEFTKENKIRIMPDTHAGAGCTIGTTMTIKDKLVPNLVGVDIGCGMEVVKLKNKHIELEKLDKMINNFIPSGFDINKEEHRFVNNINISSLYCSKNVNLQRSYLSIGTLGGGNHFIEIDKDSNGCLYLVIHSGSRNLGKQVAEYYQNLAIDSLINMKNINKALAYLQGDAFNKYLCDMKITQEFAEWNRKAIVDIIVRNMKFKVAEQFTTIHNYIDTDNMILRKGAISAQKGEKVIIPMNMRDGSIIAIGKGNADWNYSAPHGAGRLMSRSAAKENITIKEFKESMKGIFTTSVNISTIDESPMAYKPMEEIVSNIQDTVEITDIIKPIYNYKSGI